LWPATVLLEKGADLTVTSNEGWTPLNSATRKGHVDIVKLLFNKVANLVAANHGGRTPLHKASANGHEAVVKLLLENGAEPEWHHNKDK
jgi:ankyrin repeat protein